MSYRSTVLLLDLPGGGELHIYDTFDPKYTDGHTEQRRISIMIPRCREMPGGIDYDEPTGTETTPWDYSLPSLVPEKSKGDS